MTARTKRVSTEVVLPRAGETVGTVTVHIVDGPSIQYVADVAEMSPEFLHQAVFAGLQSRIGNAYSGNTTAETIEAAVTKEIENFNNNIFIARASFVKKVNAPDIVIAWVTAMGKDASDAEVVAKYNDAWTNKDEAGKKVITDHPRIAAEYIQILANKRLAKVGKQEETVDLAELDVA
jgi:hypothetical protein